MSSYSLGLIPATHRPGPSNDRRDTDLSGGRPFPLTRIEYRDILFMINEPRDPGLGIDGLSVNRINNWALLATRPISINSERVQQMGQIIHISQLDLDISTCHDYPKLLPKGKLSDIYGELTEMGTEIVLNGSVP